MTEAFRSRRLTSADQVFETLLASVRFDDVGKGRRGAVLVRADAHGHIPIVRTTTPYRAPAQPFRSLHERIAQEIRDSASLPHGFNNALIEHYTPAYSSMRHHSDQALDLAEASTIAVFSCYRDPARPSRRLLVRSKENAGVAFELPMDHGSVVTFSLDTNRRFTHAITLRTNAPDNDWLGITFRTSKTLVQFVDGSPRLADGEDLTFADEDLRREFLRLRRRENDETGFDWPPFTCTLSESDLRPPE